MKLLFVYWGVLIVGYYVATKLRRFASSFGFVQNIMMFTIYILVLIMGLRMGVNEQVTSNLGSIGFKALVITAFCVAGSMVAIFGVRKLLKMDRYGNIRNAGKNDNEASPNIAIADKADEYSESMDKSDENTNEDSEKKTSDMKSTLTIFGLVIAGMIIGALVISKYMNGILDEFDSVTSILLVVFLCVLLFIVGFELGLSGTVAANIKSVGIKAIAFPFAAVLGTLIAGVVSGMFFGFSVREGIAISAGFGWYTYAPTVISGAGAEYMVASAVSFMYNVIRETAGIVLIPVMARKFGYLEATGIPGVAAMDVCIPIIERSCREDTVVYSFATGLVMCITTSVLVPLVMGI